MSKIRTQSFALEEAYPFLRAFGNVSFKTNDGKSLYAIKGQRNPALLYDNELEESMPFLRLTPGICSSWAFWPAEEDLPYAVTDRCSCCCNRESDNCSKKACLISSSKNRQRVLRPNIVLLGANWSTSAQGGDIYASGNHLAWSDYHTALKMVEGDRMFSDLLHTTSFEGAYMTDFIKGFIDGDLGSVIKFMKEDGVFLQFFEILRNELTELNKTFGISHDIDKVMIVWGPSLMNALVYCAKKNKRKLAELLPGYSWKMFGAHYSKQARRRRNKPPLNYQEHLAKMQMITDYSTDMIQLSTDDIHNY